MSAEQAVRCVGVILALGVLIGALEDLSALAVFAQGGILDWEVLALQNQRTASGWSSRLYALFMDYRGMFCGLLVRALAAAGLLAALACGAQPLPLLALTYLGLLGLTMRSPYGLDGAHQMYRIGFGALCLFQIVTPHSAAARACLYFIGAQGAFSYLVSGVAKLVSASWRSGTALIGIFSASLYGNRRFFEILNAAPGQARLLSRGVILFECAMALAPFLGARGCLALLALGCCFHVANALLMGLNGFVFAFVGTYPAIYYLATSLRP